MDSVKIEDLVDSDPDIEFIEKDSGMSSLGGSKDETPERKTTTTVATVRMNAHFCTIKSIKVSMHLLIDNIYLCILTFAFLFLF